MAIPKHPDITFLVSLGRMIPSVIHLDVAYWALSMEKLYSESFLGGAFFLTSALGLLIPFSPFLGALSTYQLKNNITEKIFIPFYVIIFKSFN